VLAFATLNHSPLFEPTCHSPAALLEQVSAASNAGYDAMSFDIFSLRACREAGGLAAIVPALASCALEVLDISALVVTGDAEQTRQNMAEIEAFASVLRPRFVLVKVDGNVDSPARRALREMAESLAAHGTRLAIEPSAISGVRDLDEAIAVIDEMDVASMALVVDSWHYFVGVWQWATAGARSLESLAFVQIADGWLPSENAGPAELTQQTLHHRAVPGEGAFGLAAFLAPVVALGADSSGPALPMCVEVLSATWRARPVAELAKASLAAVRHLLDD
jgi:sugar phosphate isomerase/epimerase